MKKLYRRSLLVLLSALFAPSLLGTARAQAPAPSEIRISNPGVGVGNRPVVGGSAIATMHLRGLLEEEFKAEGIKITWMFLRGAGPAVNELFANDLTDFSSLGDLPSIVGRSSGLSYRALASTSIRGNSYVIVPADSNIQSVGDLRGRRVAVQKGTASHLKGVKILEAHGLTERDVRLVNMEGNAARAAIVTGDIDAAISGVDGLGLRDQGAARVVFSTKGGDPRLTSNGLFLGSEKFIRQYPEHTKRVLKTFIKAAQWLAERDGAPQEAFQLWTRSGSTFAGYKEDWGGDSLRYRLSPLIDPYVVSVYGSQITEAKRFGLIRKTFDFGQFVDSSFLAAALRELQLEQYWLPRDPSTGKPATS
ncbi:MAG: ABC transporter substrate-binding protein [Polyangiaceae bacterium]